MRWDVDRGRLHALLIGWLLVLFVVNVGMVWWALTDLEHAVIPVILLQGLTALVCLAAACARTAVGLRRKRLDRLDEQYRLRRLLQGRRG